jgi:hypothetical protein
MNLTWTLSASADEANHDQETDLTAIGSPGGASWASVAPDGRDGHQPWGWTVYNRWNDVDEGDDAVLAEGGADGESGAKAAVAVWVTEHTALTEYTFDIVAVATFRIGAPDYAAARRAAEGLMEFNVRDNTVEESADDPPGLVYRLTCVAPRGKASFVDADPEDASVPAGDVQTFTEPILDLDLPAADIEAMHEALATLDDAASGDSNDAEIEAGHDCAGHLARLLAMLGHPYNNNSEESRMERYYQNVFKVEVLSDRPMSPDEAAAINVNDGASGEVRHVVSNRELTRAEMRDALLRQGSDPEFLISGYHEGEEGGDGTGTADPVIPAWLAYAGVPLGQIPESLRESVREHREETS